MSAFHLNCRYSLKLLYHDGNYLSTAFYSQFWICARSPYTLLSPILYFTSFTFFVVLHKRMVVRRTCSLRRDSFLEVALTVLCYLTRLLFAIISDGVRVVIPFRPLLECRGLPIQGIMLCELFPILSRKLCLPVNP